MKPLQLHQAILEESIEEVSDLISQGADVNSTDYCGTTPFELAAASQNINISKLLLNSGADLGMIEEDKIASLVNASIKSRNMEFLNLLIEGDAYLCAKDEYGSFPLFHAVETQNIDIIKLLIDSGAYVDEVNNNSQTVLLTAIILRNLNILKLLIEAGADVNKKDHDKNSPLHRAIIWGNSSCAKLLLDAGADVNQVNINGNTPLHYAMTLDNLNIGRLLMEAGSNINVKNKDGFCPLHKAFETGNIDILKMLIDIGSKLNLRNKFDDNWLGPAFKLENENISQLLLDACIDFNSKGKHKYTPLNSAVITRNLKMFKLLFDAGADIVAEDGKKYTPLHCAVETKNTDLVTFLIRVGANVNCKNENGKTPLHAAAALGDFNLLRLLINAGADIHAEDRFKFSILHTAVKKENFASLKLLLASGADVNKLYNGEKTSFTIFMKNHSRQKNITDNDFVDCTKLLIECSDINLTEEEVSFRDKDKNILVSALEENADSLKLYESKQSFLVRKFFYNIIIEHVAKLRMLDYQVDPTLLDYISRTSRDDYLKAGTKELEKAKNTKLRNCWVTFFHLLVDGERKLVKYAGNEDLIRDFNDHVNSFPIYGATMQKIVTKGIIGRKSYDKAANFLSYFLPIFSPTHLIIKDTLNILCKEDWKQIC